MLYSFDLFFDILKILDGFEKWLILKLLNDAVSHNNSKTFGVSQLKFDKNVISALIFSLVRNLKETKYFSMLCKY